MTQKRLAELSGVSRTTINDIRSGKSCTDEIIKKRFLNGQTLDEISKEWGATYNKVRQIQDKALRTLRQPGLSRRYRRYYEEYIAAGSCRHVGVASFRRTGLSEVELEVLGWIR